MPIMFDVGSPLWLLIVSMAFIPFACFAVVGLSVVYRLTLQFAKDRSTGDMWWYRIVYGVGLILLCGWFLAQNIQRQILAAESASWPTVRGIVESSATRKKYRRHGSSFHYVVSYTYHVGNVPYISNNFSYDHDNTQADSLEEAKALVAGRYPIGGSVVVFYNPIDPQQSVLVPGRRLGVFILLGTIQLAGLFVGGGLVWGAAMSINTKNRAEKKKKLGNRKNS